MKASSSTTNVHYVRQIKIERTVFASFHSVNITLTDENGSTFEVAAFCDASVQVQVLPDRHVTAPADPE